MPGYLHISFIYAESHEDDMLVFIDADRYLTIPRDVYDIAYREEGSPAPTPHKTKTREEKVAEIKTRLSSKNTNSIPAAEHHEPTTVAILSDREKALGEFHPAVEEVQRVIGQLDLREPKDSPRLAGILINDEAGPDGQTFTSAQWRSMCDLIMAPMEKGSEHTPSGQHLLSAKRVIFNRMKGLPLYQLMKHVTYTPDVIRHNIVMAQVTMMGHGEHGEGTNFIPSAFSAFISGDTDFAEKEAQAMRHVVGDIGQAEPVVNKEVDATYGTSSMLSLEEQFGSAIEELSVKS